MCVLIPDTSGACVSWEKHPSEQQETKPVQVNNSKNIILMVLSDINKVKKKRRGFSPPANYTDRATAACRRS
jgi:hypothetical protein